MIKYFTKIIICGDIVCRRSQFLWGYIFMLILNTGFLFAETPTVESIQDSLITRFNRIVDYSVKIKISVKMTRLRIPQKKIKLYYKSPDKVKVVSKGFAIVPKTGLGGSPNQFLSMLKSVHLTGSEILNGREHFLLKGSVIPDSMNIPLGDNDFPEITMNLWVDASSWVISRVETFIDTQKVFQSVSEYVEVDDVFLPSKTTLSLGFKGMERWSLRHPFGGPVTDRINFEKTANKTGIVVMKFSKYKINQGLNDSIFE